ncbi:hypothetical protein D3C87_2104300 [compost metagenome]
MLDCKTKNAIKDGNISLDITASVAVNGLGYPLPVGELLRNLQQYVNLVCDQFSHFFEERKV